MTFRALTLAIILIALNGSAGKSAEPADNPVPIFDKYIEALKTDNWARAERFWTSADIESSNRLGITYLDTPVKYDCASPIPRSLAGIKAGDVRIACEEAIDKGDYAEIPVKLSADETGQTVNYFAVRTPGGWRLSSPLKVLTKDWYICETHYTRVIYSDSTRTNLAALQALDNFIESCASKLGISDTDLSRLAEVKIDYYLCNEGQIKTLTGQSVQGMVDLPSDAIVTRHLPHKHELTHLLVNYAMRTLPLYTAPFMQEGIACAIGGRWQKSPGIIDYSGYAIMKFKLAGLDDILTYNGFHRKVNNADITYPLSALLVGYLLDSLGIDQWRQLYLDLSGTDQVVQSLTVENVKSKIETACTKPWASIDTSFSIWWPQYLSIGIVPTSQEIGGQLWSGTDPQEGINFKDEGEAIYFRVAVPAGKTGGFALITTPSSGIESEFVSGLFGKHLPDEKYAGEHYGLRFTPDEIALYDFYTNELVASYVQGFSASPDGSSDSHWDPESQTYSFSIARSLLDIDSLDRDNCRLIVF